jgi:ElaB/YqjD/DUF883 family membrane-anchored ribosome-binding protein
MTATETAESLQHEIEETKSRLSARIGTLEQQYNVVENVQQASTAVAATVEAVQATAQAVNGAVETLQTATDVSSHVRKHPWLCIGGSLAAGYLLSTWWNRQHTSDPAAAPPTPRGPEAPGELGIADLSYAAGQVHATESADAVARHAYQQALLQTSPTYNLKVLAMNTLMGVAREAAARAVPSIANLLIQQFGVNSQSTPESPSVRAD